MSHLHWPTRSLSRDGTGGTRSSLVTKKPPQNAVRVLLSRASKRCRKPCRKPCDHVEPLSAWLRLVAVFAMNILVAVPDSTYGLFYDPLTELFGATRAEVGWGYSMLITTGLLIGLFASPFIDLYGPRSVTLFGSAVYTFGMIVASFSPNIICFCAFYGVIAGVGWGILLMTGMTVILNIFTYNRGLASAIISFGYTGGTVLSPLLIEYLLNEYGTRGALLIHSGLIAQSIILALAFKTDSKQIEEDGSTTSSENDYLMSRFMEDEVITPRYQDQNRVSFMLHEDGNDELQEHSNTWRMDVSGYEWNDELGAGDISIQNADSKDTSGQSYETDTVEHYIRNILDDIIHQCVSHDGTVVDEYASPNGTQFEETNPSNPQIKNTSTLEFSNEYSTDACGDPNLQYYPGGYDYSYEQQYSRRSSKEVHTDLKLRHNNTDQTLDDGSKTDVGNDLTFSQMNEPNQILEVEHHHENHQKLSSLAQKALNASKAGDESRHDKTIKDFQQSKEDVTPDLENHNNEICSSDQAYDETFVSAEHNSSANDLQLSEDLAVKVEAKETSYLESPCILNCDAKVNSFVGQEDEEPVPGSVLEDDSIQVSLKRELDNNVSDGSDDASKSATDLDDLEALGKTNDGEKKEVSLKEDERSSKIEQYYNNEQMSDNMNPKCHEQGRPEKVSHTDSEDKIEISNAETCENTNICNDADADQEWMTSDAPQQLTGGEQSAFGRDETYSSSRNSSNTEDSVQKKSDNEIEPKSENTSPHENYVNKGNFHHNDDTTRTKKPISCDPNMDINRCDNFTEDDQLDMDENIEEHSHKKKSNLAKKLFKNLTDFSVCKNPIYILFIFCNLAANTAKVMLNVQFPSAAIARGIPSKDVAGFVSIVGISNGVVRLISCFIMNYKGLDAIAYYVFGILCLMISSYIATNALTYHTMVICMIVLGISEGTSNTVFPLTLSAISGVKQFAKAVGILNAAVLVGPMLAGPFSGWLVDITKDYVITFTVAGSVAALSVMIGIIMVVFRYVRKRKERKRRNEIMIDMEQQEENLETAQS